MLLHGTEVSQYYIIASLQRTGSYLLCEGLANTGVAGYPTESIAPENKPANVTAWGLDPDMPMTEYLTQVVKHGTGRNGVFGVKMHWSQIDWVRRQLHIGVSEDSKAIDFLFPDAKFIHITRDDLRGQAISSYRAYATYEWWRKADVHNTSITNPDPPYNSKRIRFWERHFIERNKDWKEYFAKRSITPLHVEYEDLARDWRHEVRRCLTYLGLDPATVDTAPEVTFLRQADALTRAWRRRLDEEDAQTGEM
jgi:LPS sulfotransferase NodH